MDSDYKRKRLIRQRYSQIVVSYNSLQGELFCTACELDLAKDGVLCDLCCVPVHKRCVDLQVEDYIGWTCPSCAHLLRNFTNHQPLELIGCALCPQTKMILQKFTFHIGFQCLEVWCHLSCLKYIHAVTQISALTYSAQHLGVIFNHDLKRRCVHCYTSTGYLASCSFKTCRLSFHIGCAKTQGCILDEQRMNYLNDCLSHHTKRYHKQHAIYCWQHVWELQFQIENVHPRFRHDIIDIRQNRFNTWYNVNRCEMKIKTETFLPQSKTDSKILQSLSSIKMALPIVKELRSIQSEYSTQIKIAQIKINSTTKIIIPSQTQTQSQVKLAESRITTIMIAAPSQTRSQSKIKIADYKIPTIVIAVPSQIISKSQIKIAESKITTIAITVPSQTRSQSQIKIAESKITAMASLIKIADSKITKIAITVPSQIKCQTQISSPILSQTIPIVVPPQTRSLTRIKIAESNKRSRTNNVNSSQIKCLTKMKISKSKTIKSQIIAQPSQKVDKPSIYSELWNIHQCLKKQKLFFKPMCNEFSEYVSLFGIKKIFTQEHENLNNSFDSILSELRYRFVICNSFNQSGIYFSLASEINLQLFNNYTDIHNLEAFDLYVWAYFVLHGFVNRRGEMCLSEKSDQLTTFWLDRMDSMQMKDGCPLELFIQQMRATQMSVRSRDQDKQSASTQMLSLTCEVDCIILE